MQEWIWDQKWKELRPVQAAAVEPILAGDHDVIVSASTASGKTEAAWLPICSALAAERHGGVVGSGVRALYISPLKALINDQYRRLETLCDRIDLPVTRRHGDVVGRERKTLLQAPDGILLITPESLEALFVLQGSRVSSILRPLRYVVIDEMHSFIGSERGAQLQSLLHRVELAVRRRVPRIGLSATIADESIAQNFLRPGHGDAVELVEDAADETNDLLLQLRGYEVRDPRVAAGSDLIAEAEHSSDKRAIASHLFQTLRGHDNLVFANSRAAVEAYADMLSDLSEGAGLPNEFLPHHGNLSKEIREDVEARLKDPSTPTTAICTSTLEMGIDIGSADSVAQIGPPSSVSALRQRVGRSGRRAGHPAVLRAYVSETEIDGQTSILDALRPSLFQAIAVIDLMLEHGYETPDTGLLHLSTLVQQILSSTAQHGGVSAAQLFSSLCADGPFAHIERDAFVTLLRDLGRSEVLMQSSDGLLLAGRVGERLLNHYSFYASFQSSEEYRLLADGRHLGTIPVDFPVLPDTLLVFAGKRWRVLAIDSGTKTIELTRAGGGKPPMFSGGSGDIADGIRLRMRRLYEADSAPRYLDGGGQKLRLQGQTTYRQLDLASIPLVHASGSCLLFPWRGTRVLNTMRLMLEQAGTRASVEGVAIQCTDVGPDELLALALIIGDGGTPDPLTIAEQVEDLHINKNDEFLGRSLLVRNYAAHRLDVHGAVASFQTLSQSIADM